MRIPRLFGVAFAAAVAAACRESTGPKQWAPQPAVTWIEWTSVATRSQPESLRISGGLDCPYTAVWGVTVSDGNVIVTGRAYSRNVPCLNNGTGAGFDTVLVLTGLPAGGYTLSAPMLDAIYYTPSSRPVGMLSIGTIPDSTVLLAGIVRLSIDTLGCWRAQPWSAWREPALALAKAPPLTPSAAGRQAFLIGGLTAGSPAACGDAIGVVASVLEVDASPY